MSPLKEPQLRVGSAGAAGFHSVGECLVGAGPADAASPTSWTTPHARGSAACRRAPVLSAALRRLAAVSAPCWRWGRPAWSRRRGSLLSALRVPDGFLECHLDGVPVGAGFGRVGGDAVLYGGGVLRGELPGLDRLPRRTLSSQQRLGEIEGGHCGILRGVVCRAVLALLLLHPVVHGHL